MTALILMALVGVTALLHTPVADAVLLLRRVSVLRAGMPAVLLTRAGAFGLLAMLPWSGRSHLLALGHRRGQTSTGCVQDGRYFFGSARMRPGTRRGQVLPQPLQRRVRARVERPDDKEHIRLPRGGSR
ncbi:hypothetical protein AAIB46_22035 [Streptomyces sp. 35M1]|uniref:hypothetical protein n=1 Tax=Streptomyces sp. 35M1 TaxID=3142978 RepID=UPI0039908823